MTFLDEIKEESIRSIEERKATQKNIEASWLHALTPLEDRLQKLLNDMPDSVKAEGLSLPVIQKMLKGRWRGNAHPGELGVALRKLGYKRYRIWNGAEYSYVAIWRKSQQDLNEN